jgi:hypothetical protein
VEAVNLSGEGERLIQRVRAFHDLDREHLSAVIAPYVEAGWCVDDLLLALNQRPDGGLHEPWTPDRVLLRVQERLRVWRWGENGAVMPGEWTAMRDAMRAAAQAQAARQRQRAADWQQRAAAAQASTGDGLAAARQAVAAAAARSRHRRALVRQAALRDRQRQAEAARR